MSVLVKNLTDFVKVLVQSFNLSSTFPALLFVLLMRLLIIRLPANAPFKIIEKLDPSVETGLALIVVSLVAYLLDAANISIIRFFEGYPVRHLPFFRKQTESNADFIRDSRNHLQNLSAIFDELIKTKESETDLQNKEIWEAWIQEVNEYLVTLGKDIEDVYPENPDLALPFRFGNAIAAAEYYPYKTFGMSSVTLWPFLAPILTEKNYAPFVLREKAAMDFMLNLTLVLIAFSGLFVITFVYGVGALEVIELGILIWLSSLFVSLAIQAAHSWGSTIKTAFVIFREDLRRSLRMRQASSYADERELWQNCSDFFRAVGLGEHQLEWGAQIFDASSYAVSYEQKEKSQ